MVVLASGKGRREENRGLRLQFATSNMSREGLKTHQKIVNKNYTPSALWQVA